MSYEMSWSVFLHVDGSNASGLGGIEKSLSFSFISSSLSIITCQQARSNEIATEPSYGPCYTFCFALFKIYGLVLQIGRAC